MRLCAADLGSLDGLAGTGEAAHGLYREVCGHGEGRAPAGSACTGSEARACGRRGKVSDAIGSRTSLCSMKMNGGEAVGLVRSWRGSESCRWRWWSRGVEGR